MNKSEKYCRRCDEFKSVEEFHKNKSSSDGRVEFCAPCRSEYRRVTGQYSRQRFYRIRNRVKEFGAYDNLTFEEYQRIDQRNECAYCGYKESPDRVLDFEHIYPTRYGGSNSYANLIPACKSCNNSKGTDDILTFYERSPKFTEALFKKFLEEYATNNGHSTEDMLDMLRFRQTGERLVKARKAARKVGA